jgi:hypothetical protein
LLEVPSETPTTETATEPEEEQEIVYTCGQSQAPDATEDEAEVGVEYNNEETTSTTSGNLELKKWVDLNLISRYHEVDGTMDITFHIGEFQLEFTVAGNPFHHKKDTDIIFCPGCHAFVLNFKLFNQPIQLPDIEGLRFDPPQFGGLPFDFNKPICAIG